jgi:hypothetical protein
VETVSPWEWASCFISTANQHSDGGWSIWSEIRGRELAILFFLIVLGLVGKSVYNRKRFNHAGTQTFTEETSEWILF